MRKIVAPDARLAELTSWAGAHFNQAVKLSPLAGDASFRRYFRIRVDGGGALAMDSPPPENLKQLLASADILRAGGALLPAIYAADADNGFALLQDFGDDLYLRALSDSTADNLYARAFRALIKIQSLPAAGLPVYGKNLLSSELLLYRDWFCPRYCRQPLSETETKVFFAAHDFLIADILRQPQVIVHRDYHSRNLIRVAGKNTPGILDWQDAVVGAVAYDIASLLRDAYIEWTVEKQRRWLTLYWRRARQKKIPLPGDFNVFWRQFNIAAVHRALKVLGIFARLSFRDKKHAYIKDMPRVHRHLLTGCAAVPELAALKDLIARRAP